ncbi:leucine--tRNA ligase [Candidatus Mycosynbacter amalyticus]|uniref:Leucine--tRNA ligase n=1 Tax=Candidatus Mycosynbacter amalyticus TaxID=2665156 RepID=A0A857MK62_9BACT|nr:class I tRNA ligase family protein [Candidatus Mycosynbacter amalyticus]QHN42974.1 leucine--tRNA ligase [Candidatus Mycosynbacter amalyticus]
MRRYNPTETEPKWQQIWADDARYRAKDFDDKPKYYVTGMFPYPSGAGMHTGHFFEHSIVDAVARFRRALGHNVVYPMGWDSFGLPAENYAIKTGTAPAVVTKQNIANFKNQLTRVGASIDWSREINTTDPEYYKWTQWVFTQMFERDLAYQKESLQWWCPVDKTVLANEQVEGGKCWRCGSEVEKKSMKQWFFKITDYADELLEEIPDLNWPEKIKTAQTNWIGRSQGAEIDFAVEGRDELITVFSTRPDTLFGATFLVLAPEHPLARSLATDEMRENVEKYIDDAVKKSEIERQSEGKEKTGVWTGSYAVNPVNGEKIPIWVADYVLGGYGTGAVMAVPAHDERDFAFATKYELPIVQVVAEYEVLSGKLAPREDWPTRKKQVVDAIITDGEGNYLLQVEKVSDTQEDVHFVGGGVDEEDESIEMALRREILEEVGYPNIISIRQVAPFSGVHAQRTIKNRNHQTWGAYYEVVIDKTVQVDSEIEQGLHGVIWAPKSEVVDMINWSTHAKGWRDYLAGKLIDTDVREGLLVNSGAFDGTHTSEAREEIVAWLEQQGVGRSKVIYKMRDWLISRQRYWGAPIPIIHCDEHGAVPVPADQLPVVLPEVADYAPKGDGKSVLARETDWVNTTCPTCGKPAKRETDTMDGYACSSWYLLRYTDSQNAKQAWDPAKADYWSPVDMYIGGDHAVAHLLYVRFWNHVFYDMGLVPEKEPVKQLVYHGLIQAEDGTKMSKSKGNVVDPLEVIDAGYGADALRTFELFLGPINENSNWSSKGIAGVYRFLNRVWTLVQEYDESDKAGGADSKKLDTLTHATTKKVTDDIRRLSFNTAIAALMEYVNDLYKLKTEGFTADWQQPLETLVTLLQPFAPHMTAELWEQLGRDTQLDFEQWPSWDESKIISDTMMIIVQVNGKLRAKLELAVDTPEEDVKSAALADEHVQQFLGDKKPTKVIYVPGRLVSIVK